MIEFTSKFSSNFKTIFLMQIWWLLCLLLVFVYADLDSISFGLTEGGHTYMSALASLSNSERTLEKTIMSYVSSSTSEEVLLNPPISFNFQITSVIVSGLLTPQTTLYNKYEYFHPTGLCPYTYGSGGCSNESSRPPPSGSGDENYVLCCLGSLSNRGQGEHCLRYDYSRKYHTYSLSTPVLQHYVTANFVGLVGADNSSNGNNNNYTFTLNYPSQISQTIPNVGTVSLSISPNMQYNPRPWVNFPLSYLVVHTIDNLQNASSSSSSSDLSTMKEFYDINKWFMINEFQTDMNKLTMSAATWKALATCQESINSETMMNEGLGGDDQFYVFRNNYTVPVMFNEKESQMFIQVDPVDNEVYLMGNTVADDVILEILLENV